MLFRTPRGCPRSLDSFPSNDMVLTPSEGVSLGHLFIHDVDFLG
jgi:hypothetical protein